MIANTDNYRPFEVRISTLTLMSRICRNMGDSGKLRFYELDHESKIGLLKTHSHTSNGLAMEPGTRKEKQLKEMQTLQQGKIHPSKTWRVPPV